MVLIAENLHIISPTTKEAIVKRYDDYILKIAHNVLACGVDIFDLNVGPAKGELKESLPYLTKLIKDNCKVSIKFSFDTSNFDEMELGFSSIDKNCAEKSFLNSICADDAKMEAGFRIANKYNPNIIALTFNPKDGIKKTSDERMELGLSIYEKALCEGILENKLYFDPLVLPVSVAQEQANTVLETIRMMKEGMGEINTVIGLSNISNGSPLKIRALLNRVFLVLAMGAGLDSAIIDGFDKETIRIYNMVKENCMLQNNPQNSLLSPLDSLYCSLYNAVNSFCDIDDIVFDKNNIDMINIMKAARILLNKEIYSHSFYLK